MTYDSNIPDGMDEFEANKFIRNADDKIFKKKDTSGKKPSKQPIAPKKDWKDTAHFWWYRSGEILLCIGAYIAFSILTYIIGRFVAEEILRW